MVDTPSDYTWAKLLENGKAFLAESEVMLLSILPNSIAGIALEDNEKLGLFFFGSLFVIFVLWILFRHSNRPKEKGENLGLADLTLRPRIVGYFVAFFLVMGIGGWSSIAPLAGAALAPGVISPDGNRKTIQHLEGGIIRQIHVREGDTVEPGQLLVSLEDLEAKANLNEVEYQFVHLLSLEARLVAEQTGSSVISLIVSHPHLDQSELKKALSDQQFLLEQRMASRVGRDKILRKRVEQVAEENAGLQKMILGQDRQEYLIQEEITAVNQLLERGMERRPRLLALERLVAGVGINRAENESLIARNHQKIGETQIQLLTARQQDVEKVSEELSTVRRRLAGLEGQVPWREDVVARTEIRAPISGTVMNLGVTTLAGVVRSGEPIMDIVPDSVPLIVDAHVKTTDIDVIRVGMSARILLTAYQQRNLPRLYGTLRSVSADRFVDERSGQSYYLAKIEVPRHELENLPEIELVPGMPADVMLLTGEATVADYIIGPLLGSIRNSFRENQGT